MNQYVLDGHTPVPASDIRDWGRWFEKADRHVAKTEINHVTVSTVFLGLDHAFGGGTPILFETLVFGGPLDGEMERYATWDQAEAGHKAIVERVNGAMT
jgi:hypothetical protein